MLTLVYSLFYLFRFCWQSPLTWSAHRSLKLGLADYQKFLEELAKAKKVDLTEIREKMIQCGPPATTGTTVSFIFFSKIEIKLYFCQLYLYYNLFDVYLILSIVSFSQRNIVGRC